MDPPPPTRRLEIFLRFEQTPNYETSKKERNMYKCPSYKALKNVLKVDEQTDRQIYLFNNDITNKFYK